MKTSEEKHKTQILVMKDTKYKAYFAYRVQKKGAAEEWIFKDLGDDIEIIGHQDIVLKADREPAIKEVQDKLRRSRREGTVIESCNRADSQESGFIEGANNIVKAQIRTTKDALDTRIGEKIPAGASIMTWVVRYAGQLLNRYSVGEDGKTAFRRIRGKNCTMPVAEFGENIWYKPHESVQPKGEDKAEARWN